MTANLYVQEYKSIGQVPSGPVPAPREFTKQQVIALSSTHAESTLDFASNTVVLRLKNEGAVTCFYKTGTTLALSISPAVAGVDRAILAGETEDIYEDLDIHSGNIRISAVTF